MITAFENTECVKCKQVLKEMNRIGAFAMCIECTKEIFKTNDPARKERKAYI